MLRSFAMWTLLLVLAIPVAAQAPLERKNIDALSAHELAVYKHAIDTLQHSTDPNNGYDYHAGLHNVFGRNPPHGCEHGNDLFFPWHRRHLANFEKALQASDPDHPTLSTRNVTIPYWNWTEQASGARYPKVFENEFDAPLVHNPLFDEFRNLDASAPFFDNAYMDKIVRDNSNWNQFAGGVKTTRAFFGAFEQPAHNDMHGSYVGGDMGNTRTAALDPIFWSYHAYIDLRWDQWQKIHGKPPTSLTAVLQGFAGAPTVNGTIDIAALGYFYAHAAQSIKKSPVKLTAAPTPRTLTLTSALAGAGDSVALWGGKGPFSFKSSVPKNFDRADLWFDDIRIPATRSYRAKVFVHPFGKPHRAEDAAGFIAVWVGHASADGDAHHLSGNMFLTVTDALRKALAANPGKEIAFTVEVEPIVQAKRPRARAQPVLRALSEEVQFKSLRLVLDGNGTSEAPAADGADHGH